MLRFFKKSPPPPSEAERRQQERTSRTEAVVDAVLLSGVVLPTYPAILREMDALMAHEDFAVSQLAVVVARDPSMTAALLRVVNSPVFGLQQSVTRVSQALSLLGVGRVQAVIRSEVLRDALQDYGDPKLLQNLWERFGKIGKIAAILASRSTYLKNLSDLAYTIGIFHGVGAFILIKRFPKETQVLANAVPEFEQVMLALNGQLKTDHASIGGIVAKSWRLPPSVIDVIGRQRSWQQLSGPSAALACLLRLAILIHDGDVAGEEWDATWQAAQSLVGLKEATLQEVSAIVAT